METNLLPNATLFPNFLTDEVMPLVSGDEWKIIHFGVVACMRHDRGSDYVSIAQFARGTGLSEERVRECLAFLCDTAQIFLRQDRPRQPQVYRLNQEISAAQLEILERRKKGLPLSPEEAAGEERVPEQGIVERQERRGQQTVEFPQPALFPERPSVEIRLNGDDQAVTRRLRRQLPAPERQAFDHLVRLYTKGQKEIDDAAAWGLYRLWQTYGFACVNNALQGPYTDLSDLNRACLLAEITKLYEQEIGRLTPASEQELARLAAEHPVLSAWQEAFRTAVRLNKRRLSTLETILNNQRQKEMEAAAAAPSRSRRRTREQEKETPNTPKG